MAQTARLLWFVYVLFTLIEFVMLLVVGQFGSIKMGAFDAACGGRDPRYRHWLEPVG